MATRSLGKDHSSYWSFVRSPARHAKDHKPSSTGLTAAAKTILERQFNVTTGPSASLGPWISRSGDHGREDSNMSDQVIPDGTYTVMGPGGQLTHGQLFPWLGGAAA